MRTPPFPSLSSFLRIAIASAILAALGPSAAAASDATVGFSRLTYVCPTSTQIDFTWDQAVNATFYSLQLIGPVNPSINGGVTGTYLPQFGSIEVANGTMTSASVSLAAGSLTSPLTLSWEVMVGGPTGYEGMIPTQQTANIPMPCTQTTPSR
ncbi:MAG: hypothetical protein KGJ86_02175 [Chloroflexota bacterium]|nr:hypothetical protein [Chloroflexota bacterium]